MARYQLPDSVGGRIWKATKDLPNATMVWFRLPGDAGSLEIRRDMLIPVDGPQLPPEPPLGSVVLVGADNDEPETGCVFRRYRDGWAAPADDIFMSWAGVCEYSVDGNGPVLLAPVHEEANDDG